MQHFMTMYILLYLGTLDIVFRQKLKSITCQHFYKNLWLIYLGLDTINQYLILLQIGIKRHLPKSINNNLGIF